MDLMYIFSQIFVVISYVLLSTTYSLKNRNSILVFNMFSILFNCLSYAFLSAWLGFFMMVIAIIRNIVFVFQNKGDKQDITTSDWITLGVLYLISIIFAVISFDGIWSLLSVAATMLYTFSVWQKSTKVYKFIGIPVSLLWIFYNIYVKSLFGIVCELVVLICVSINLLKNKLNTKSKSLIN